MRAREIMALLTVVTASAAAAATAVGQTGQKVEPVTGEPTALAVQSVPKHVQAGFALFRERAASPIPAPTSEYIGAPGSFGRNSDLAREFSTAAGTGWVIPGDGYLCIAIPDPLTGYAESCAPTEVALKNGLWVRVEGDGQDASTTDALLVPDGTVVHAPGTGTSSGAPGVVVHEGVASDPRPTVTPGQ